MLDTSTCTLRRHRHALPSRACYFEDRRVRAENSIDQRPDPLLPIWEQRCLTASVKAGAPCWSCLSTSSACRHEAAASHSIFQPGFAAFRRPLQVRQCASLMTICGQQPQESSNVCLQTCTRAPTCSGRPSAQVCCLNCSHRCFSASTLNPGCLLTLTHVF